MALNLNTFKTRTLTAIVFAVVMLLGLLVNSVFFTTLFLIIMAGCLWEFVKIVNLIAARENPNFILLGVPYIVFPIYELIYLGTHTIEGNQLFSPLIPCGIIFSIWINDTAAYLVGSLIGKTPLTKISPKKTWEGTIGGILICISLVTILGANITIAKELAWQHWMTIAAICGVFGTFGDLLESKLKRSANIKDSGQIMPGHGGFLDRFDSLLIAVPFVWLYIKIIL